VKLTGPMILLALAVASRGSADPLTLPQAQAEARAHAPERAIADAGVVAASTRAEAAGHWITHDPVLVGRTQQPAPGQDVDDRSYGAGLEWTLDVSGAWRARAAAARATVQAAQDERSAALLDLDVVTATAFAEVADAQRRLARASQLLALSETALHVAERRRSTGEGNQLDLDAALLEASVARIARANAQGELDATRARLVRLLGRRDDGPLEVADDLDRSAAPSPLAIDDLVARDPRVHAAIAKLDAARATADAARLAARPDVTLGLQLDHARHAVPAGAFAALPSLTGAWNEWEISVQLGLSLPLFHRNRVARAEASAQVIAAEARLARTRADARASVIEARAHLAAALAAADAAAEIPQVLQREIQLLDRALQAGGLDLAAWATQARRLAEAGHAYDDAALALRRARAAWARLAAP